MEVEEGGLQEEGAMPVRRSCFGVRTLGEAWGLGPTHLSSSRNSTSSSSMPCRGRKRLQL